MTQIDHPLLPSAPLSIAEAGKLVLPMQEGRVSKFVRLAGEMQAIEAEEAREAGQIGYINTISIQATLPYLPVRRDPSDVHGLVGQGDQATQES